MYQIQLYLIQNYSAITMLMIKVISFQDDYFDWYKEKMTLIFDIIEWHHNEVPSVSLEPSFEKCTWEQVML